MDISNISANELDSALQSTASALGYLTPYCTDTSKIPQSRMNSTGLVGWVDYHDVETQAHYHSRLLSFENWLEAGHAGEMQYLTRQHPFRKNPETLFHPIQTVITFAFPYYSGTTTSSPTKGTEYFYAKYLRGIVSPEEQKSTDYHFQIKQKIEKFLNSLKSDSLTEQNLEWKICVDTSGVLERSWAELCGLGWIGKNTLLIHPQWGSHLLLGVAFLSRSTGRKPHFLKNLCGHCSLCLKTCPSKAFEAPYVLNSRKCMSYLTLEKRGDFSPQESKWIKKFPPTLAGCDLCQDACPFNKKAFSSDQHWFENTNFDLEASQKITNTQVLVSDKDQLQRETEIEYRNRVKHSALSRIKFQDFKRNLKKEMVETAIPTRPTQTV